MIEISVVIPHRDNEDGLKKLLESLNEQRFDKNLFEVIVVNNAQRPLVLSGFDSLNIVSLHCGEGFAYAARNWGIRHSQGRIVAFTDSDCMADPAWLASGEEVLRANERLLVAGDIRVFSSSPKPTLAEKHQMTFAFDQPANVSYDRGIPTANLMVNRDAFIEVGLFNPDMLSGGDAEWTRRARHHGYLPVYVEAARVYHPARKTVGAIREQRKRHAKAIESFSTVTSRLSWYLRWITPRQGVLSRLRKKQGLSTSDKAGVFAVQIVLTAYQVWLGAVSSLFPTPPEIPLAVRQRHSTDVIPTTESKSVPSLT